MAGCAGRRAGGQRPGQDAALEASVLVEGGPVPAGAGDHQASPRMEPVVPAQGTAPDRAAGIEVDPGVAVELGPGEAGMAENQPHPQHDDQQAHAPNIQGAEPGPLDNPGTVP